MTCEMAMAAPPPFAVLLPSPPSPRLSHGQHVHHTTSIISSFSLIFFLSMLSCVSRVRVYLPEMFADCWSLFFCFLFSLVVELASKLFPCGVVRLSKINCCRRSFAHFGIAYFSVAPVLTTAVATQFHAIATSACHPNFVQLFVWGLSFCDRQRSLLILSTLTKFSQAPSSVECVARSTLLPYNNTFVSVCLCVFLLPSICQTHILFQLAVNVSNTDGCWRSIRWKQLSSHLHDLIISTCFLVARRKRIFSYFREGLLFRNYLCLFGYFLPFDLLHVCVCAGLFSLIFFRPTVSLVLPAAWADSEERFLIVKGGQSDIASPVFHFECTLKS